MGPRLETSELIGEGRRSPLTSPPGNSYDEWCRYVTLNVRAHHAYMALMDREWAELMAS